MVCPSSSTIAGQVKAQAQTKKNKKAQINSATRRFRPLLDSDIVVDRMSLIILSYAV
jgi:hypothetical protein